MATDSRNRPENASVRVAAVQMEPRLGDVPANRASIVSKLREAATGGARLVVFPECALSGYGFASRAGALVHAEPIPGPSTTQVSEACSELGATFAVFGMLERDGDRLFNTCVLVGPKGVIGSYRKIHLPFL